MDKPFLVPARMGANGGLASFIRSHREDILGEWEGFARTLLPASAGLSIDTLRDHADSILTAIVSDMDSLQSGAEQTEKSRGRGERRGLEPTANMHAALRMESGFR